MEVISSQGLWKDYDRKSLPLNVSIISKSEEKGIITERLYFSGAASADGVARVYCRLVYPVTNTPLPVIIVLSDANETDVDHAGEYAVLHVDFTGRKDRERYTIYPHGMRYADLFYTPDATSRIPALPSKTCWYVWATAALRALTFIESRAELNETKVAVIGSGIAGSTVWKMAMLESIKVGIIINESGCAHDDIGFKASLDSSSYSGKTRAPVLSVCCSNGENLSADTISAITGVGTAECYLNIRPRAFRGVSEEQINDIEKFLDYLLKDKNALPEKPHLTLRASDGKLYCDIFAPNSVGVQLYEAHEVGNPALRNWRMLSGENVGEGEYLAKAEIYNEIAPVYFFAQAEYADGLTLSTEMAQIVPQTVGVKATALKSNRLIYDSDMGVDDWISGDGGSAKMAEGPFGISGVTSDMGHLATFKPGDRAFTGKDDYVLQAIMFSETEEIVTMSVTTSNGEKYECKRALKPSDNWTKISLNSADFKSEDGALSDWQAVAAFSLSYKGAVIINSMLWV